MDKLVNTSELQEQIDQLVDKVRMMMHGSEGEWAYIGIKRRGDLLAQRLAEQLAPQHIGSVDITLYRDDFSEIGPGAIVRGAEIDFDLNGLNVLLVDDVIMSGRSVRSALQAIMDYGRPQCIKLLVLVDRGGRELPIQPDLTGIHLDMDPHTRVDVHLTPLDEEDEILAHSSDHHRAPDAASQG